MASRWFAVERIGAVTRELGELRQRLDVSHWPLEDGVVLAPSQVIYPSRSEVLQPLKESEEEVTDAVPELRTFVVKQLANVPSLHLSPALVQ